jgi:hypothetical protein
MGIDVAAWILQNHCNTMLVSSARISSDTLTLNQTWQVLRPHVGLLNKPFSSFPGGTHFVA